jgi:hypothetical protein
MILACLRHRFGLGLLDERRALPSRPASEAASFSALRRPWRDGALGIEIDHAFERQCEGGFVDHDLGSAGAREARELDRFQPHEAREPPCWRSSRADRFAPMRRLRTDAAWRPAARSVRSAPRAPPAPAGSATRSRRSPRDRSRAHRPSAIWRGSDRARAIAQRMPQLFGDEGHEGVEHHEDLIEHPAGDGLGLVIDRAPLGPSPCEQRLDQFEIPVAELVPDEAVDGVGGLVEAQVGEALSSACDGRPTSADDPAVDRQRRGGRLDSWSSADAVRLAEARGIPQLGREVAIAFDARSSSLMSRPWLSIAASVKRSASAPYWSISPSGSTVLPFDLDIFCAVGHRGRGRGGRASSTALRP